MAICKFCEKDMLEVDSCILIPVTHNGKDYEPLKFGEDGKEGWAKNGKCPDCGIKLGGYHHSGCDVEVCPICHGQLISCGCIDEN